MQDCARRNAGKCNYGGGYGWERVGRRQQQHFINHVRGLNSRACGSNGNTCSCFTARQDGGENMQAADLSVSLFYFEKSRDKVIKCSFERTSTVAEVWKRAGGGAGGGGTISGWIGLRFRANRFMAAGS